MKEAYLAIDMGGSKYMVGLVTPLGEVLGKKRCLWEGQAGETILQQVEKSARELLKEFGGLCLTGVGATIPGLADAKTGTWLEASFSGVRNLPVAQWMAEAFELPSFADNDAQACALAEKLFGGGRDCKDFLYITVSNGIGGAAFSGNRLLQGAANCALELGHCTLVPEGRPCKCGNRGCLEAYAAGPGLSKTYEELTGSALGGEEMARRARAGEKPAIRAFQMEGEYLGLGISWAINLLNPEKVLIGGGLSLASDLYMDRLCGTLQRTVYHTANPVFSVEPTSLGYDGALLGAAAVCLCRMEKRYYDFE